MDDLGINWDEVAAEAAAESKKRQASEASAATVDPTAQAQVEHADERNFFQDMSVNGILGGVEQAGRGVYSTVKGAAEVAGAELPDLGDPIIDKPQGLAASITRDVTQFGLGFVGGMGVLKATGAAAKLAPVAKELIASGIGTGVVADPTAPRLSNLIQKYPALENPITEFLAQDDKDGIAASKLKATLEDMMFAPLAMGLTKALVGLKHAMKGDAKAAHALADEVAQDLAQAGAKVDVSPNISTSVNVPHPTDADLFKAFPGSQLDNEITMASTDSIKFGHDMTSDAAKASTAKYVKQFQEDPSKIPAIIREELPDGTFQTPSGNGRLAAAKQLGIKEIPVVNWKSADTVAARAKDLEIKTANGRVAFKLTPDEAKAMDAHIDYMVKTDHLEDIVPDAILTKFNPRRSDATPEAQEMVEAFANYIQPKLDKKMGRTRTHAETEKMADALGMKADQVYANLQSAFKATQNLDVTITAAKGLMYSSVREIRKLANKMHYGVSTVEDKAQMTLLQKRATDIIGMTMGVRKGAARATAAGRITTGERDMDELVQLLALTKDDQEAIGLLKQKSYFGKLIDAHNEFWINSILSGVKTHVINVTSATVQTLLTPANQIIGGVLTRNRGEIREGFALYRGMRRNIFEAITMAARSFQAEKAILDPGRSSDEIVSKAISSDNLGGGRFVDYLGHVSRIPSRFLKAEDEFFKQLNYRAKLEAMASREAADLVDAKKLDPTKMVTHNGKQVSEVEKYIQEKFQSAFHPDNAAMHKEALEYGREAVFGQDLNSIKTYDWFGNPGARMQQFASGHPLLRGTILPFIKVPTNIFRAAGDMTPPIAMLKKEGMDILTGKNVDPHQKAMFMGRLTTGTMLWTGAIMLATEGRITGAPYGDKQMRARQMESGWQPYSIKFEGADGKPVYVSYQRLDPYGSFFGLAADFAYLSQHVDPATGDSLAMQMALSLAKNLASKSYLQGVVEWAGMVGGGVTAEEQAQRMLNMRAGSYVPQYMNLYTGNDELKEVRSAMDAIMVKIPGMSDKIEAKRDYFGEKRMAPMGYPWNAIDPFPVSSEKDVVRTELARLSRSQSETKFETPSTLLGTIDLTAHHNKQGQTAYDRWTELIGTTTIGGETFHERLKGVIESDRYKAGTDGTSVYREGSRVVMLKRWQEKYREKALHEMLKEFQLEDGSALKDMVRADKMNKKDVKRGRVDEIRDLLNIGN